MMKQNFPHGIFLRVGDDINKITKEVTCNNNFKLTVNIWLISIISIASNKLKFGYTS